MTREEVRARLELYRQTDNRVTELSRAYRIQVGAGWYTPPGVVHAPGSYLTYEPQWNSDVNSVFENVVNHEVYPYEFLVENCPDENKEDLDYVMSLMDWDANVDSSYRKTYFRPPRIASESDQHIEKWVVYSTGYFAAKELTVYAGASVTVRDDAAYGCVLTQGHGKLGVYDAETATMLRFGQLSADEYFVSEQRARAGLTITNLSNIEPLVMLKHFGPNAGDPRIG